MESYFHSLELPYENFIENNESIADLIIGKYKVLRKVGERGIGQLFLGVNTENEENVSIKLFNLKRIKQQNKSKALDTILRLCRNQPKTMLSCNNENIAKCFDIYESQDFLIVVFEYCNGDTLFDEVQKQGRIPQENAIQILKQILNGLAQLHSKNIIHRDLRPESIQSHDGIYKIVDFGFSKVQTIKDQIKQTTCGITSYMAPELLNKKPYGYKVDIWSIGITFFFMVCGKVPFEGYRANQVWESIKRLHNGQIDDNMFPKDERIDLSKEAIQFLKQTLQIESKKRFSLDQLMNHPIFNRFQQIKESEINDHQRFSLLTQESCFYEPSQSIEQDVQIKKQQKLEIMPKSTLITEQQIYEQQIYQKSEEIHKNTTIVETNYVWPGFKEENVRYDQGYQNQEEDLIKEMEFQCAKTDFIYKELVLNIQFYKILDPQKREVIELMYLMITRCMNNISALNDKCQKSKEDLLFVRVSDEVKRIYKSVSKKFVECSDKLTQVQNKMSSKIADRTKRTVFKAFMQKKDNLLTGIQTLNYSKQEQIEFTYEQYINKLIEKIKLQSEQSKAVSRYLKKYVDINRLSLKDTKGETNFKKAIEFDCKM